MKNGRPRPTLVPGAAIYAQRSRTVQPPDDRTYSAEVTSFPSNLLHHRSVRIVFPIARRYDTTPLPYCQALFQRNSRNMPPVLGQNRDLAVCAMGWYFWQLFRRNVKHLVQTPSFATRRGDPCGRPLAFCFLIPGCINRPAPTHRDSPEYSAAFPNNPLHSAGYAHNSFSATQSPSSCPPDYIFFASGAMSGI